ncbi:hypothetical protein CBOM_04114 [Ceraceosorus bombacis]|uniref:Alpha/beta hydrolase fold-3 domain-containing protein n=1 Tax=Ceraceosorus bombacis TaxID=401625 RepID=A0A0P1BMM2_9BASI|nr:hypothetical protein CBOM_04114 [Ceraceosorus bombacis]
MSAPISSTSSTNKSGAATRTSPLGKFIESAPKIDPAVALAVRKAGPPRVKYFVPILRMILFHLWFLPSSAILIPLLIAKNALPWLRTHRGWSFRLALGIEATRWAMRNFIFFRLQPIAPRQGGLRERPGLLGALLQSLNASGPGGRVVLPKQLAKTSLQAAKKQNRRRDRIWFDAPQLEYFRGILAIQPGKEGTGAVRTAGYRGPALVEPKWAKAKTRGFWFMRKDGEAPPEVDEKKSERPVILYFHGGAGVTFGAGDIFMGMTLAQNLARTSGIDVFSVDYNLAPFAPCPVPLSQAVGAWIHLQSLGYSPNQIFIGGDSYGGWLTLQLERYLRFEMPALHGEDHNQKPLGLILLSPQLATVNEPFAARERHLKYDIIVRAYPEWGIDAQRIGPKHAKRAGPLADLTNTWVSPYTRSKEEFAELPPIFVANGALECLVDEGIQFVAAARNAGVRNVEHDIAAHEPHDYFTMATSLPVAIRTYKRLGKWAHRIIDERGYEVA